MLNLRLLFVILFAFVTLVMPTPSRALLPPDSFFLMEKEAGVAAKIHSQELAGDLSEKNIWLAALHPKDSIWLPFVAARSLARMGVTEALPQFDKRIQYGGINVEYFKIWRARLIVEAEGKSSGKTTATSAQRKLKQFFAELSVTPKWINEEIEKFEEVRRTWDPQKTQFPSYPASHPFAELTMYEVADMIYRSDNPGAWLKLPQVKALDFRLNPLALMKLRYADVPLEKRPQLMAEDLAKMGGISENFMLLMSDLGKPVREAVAKKIEEIVKNETAYLQTKVTASGEKYRTIPAYRPLFRFLADSGDRDYEPLMERSKLNKIIYGQAFDSLNVRGPKIYDPRL